MKKILNFILIGVIATFTFNCEDESVDDASVNYVTFEEGPASFEVTENATDSKEFTVYAGNKTGSDRTFNILVSDASTISVPYTVASTVTIPANTNVGTFTVTATDTDALKYVAEQLVLEFQDVVGTSLGDALTINVSELCPFTKVRFQLTLDTWPDETTWSVVDENNTVLDSGGPYVNPDDDFAVLPFDYCLDSGTYTVTVNDAFGDGGPSFSVTVGSDIVINTAISGFGTSASFTVE